MTLFTDEYRGGDPALWFLDCLGVVRADAATTGGSYGLTEVWAPRGSGSTTHTHTHEDETFFVLDGELRLWHDGGPPEPVRSGRLVFLPRGASHAFEVSSESAHFCVISTPAGFEEFYRRLGIAARAAELPPVLPNLLDPDRVLGVLADLGVVVHGPRPGAPADAIG